MSSFIASQVSRALGTEQDVDDDDVNTPLVSKYTRDMGLRRSDGRGRTMTAFLVVFAVLCACVVVTVATLGTAETADIADGKGGFLFSEKGATVLHNVHRQNKDWDKTIAKEAHRGAGQPDEQQVEGLQRKVHELEKELHSQSASAVKAPAVPIAHLSSMGHHAKEDYAQDVQRKEKAEEDNIQKRVASMEKAAAHVDVAGLDSRHRQILRDMKREIHQENHLARQRANKDLLARQAEINSLMPSDDDCPGPKCLLSSQPHSPARAAERKSMGDQHKFMVVHKNPPWHTHYPSEYNNVLSSWLGGVKVMHGAHPAVAYAHK
mmetsp:Transcript_57593/g.141220  ORF Transcript_57593/g.141220 Transcript_57593/m.141220 type:complete len:321 (-) Transcript_57593:138-1100(-)